MATDKGSASETEEKSEEYSDTMQARMGGSLTYVHEDGMNFNRITDDIIVGSCLQVAADADRLVKEDVGPVICLQQDTDMAYFDLDIAPVQERCAEVGLRHERLRINDFDAFHLRQRLPQVIKDMYAAHVDAGGTAYVHCTAGMGRAPAVALAYMWWVRGVHLEEGRDLLLSKRACHPKLFAIREAATDVLFGGEPQEVVITKRGSSFSESVEVAGLDVGWGNSLPMTNIGGDVWELRRTLPPGCFPFKFVMAGSWSYDVDLFTVFDGGNTNNAVEVIPAGMTEADMYARERVLKPDGRLTAAEQARLREWLGVPQP